MAKEYRAKIFKSGNSYALRLPRELGLAEGEEMVIVPHDDGRFTLWKQSESLETLMSLYGSMSPGFMKDGRGDIEQDERDWDRKRARSAA
jgi:antitoxin VapB